MARKLRIAILYNEPVTEQPGARKYVAANGRLQEGPPLAAGSGGRGVAGREIRTDLSEVGVLEEMEDIRNALNTLGYRTTILNVNSDVFRLLDHLRENRPDLVFNLVECVENESLQEMHVAGLYELLKIPYTGAGPMALGLALNKPRVKEVLAFHGIPTPRFEVYGPADRIAVREDLRFPLIVKPSREDASVGISDDSVVSSLGELRRRVRFIHQEFGQPALVEEYIRGRELNVALIGNTKPIVMPISEIDFSGLEKGMQHIVSYEAKWMHGSARYEGTRGVCPAVLTPETEARLRDTALRCYRIVGCRDYARVDFRLTDQGEPYVLEVNPNPDIADDAGFARSAKAYGMSFDQIVGRIVEYALERCP
ncbi:MAG: ATP-grasp domain-containing protein [Bacteroidota bacterium]